MGWGWYSGFIALVLGCQGASLDGRGLLKKNAFTSTLQLRPVGWHPSNASCPHENVFCYSSLLSTEAMTAFDHIGRAVKLTTNSFLIVPSTPRTVYSFLIVMTTWAFYRIYIPGMNNKKSDFDGGFLFTFFAKRPDGKYILTILSHTHTKREWRFFAQLVSWLRCKISPIRVTLVSS